MNRRSVRMALMEDLAAVLKIRNDAVAYKLSCGDVAWGKSAWTESYARQRIELNELLVIQLDGTPVGMFSLFWEDLDYWGPQEPDAGYIHRLAVRNDFRRVGLGRYAIDWCANQVRAMRRNRLRLDCDANNEKLCAYYESLGFTRVGTKPVSSDYVASLYERGVDTTDKEKTA